MGYETVIRVIRLMDMMILLALKSRTWKLLLLLVVACSSEAGQTISQWLPREIRNSDKYAFYLHGGVVTVLGNNAINQSVPEWGPYEYLNILDSIRKRGFNVISENRKESIDDSVYVSKIVGQVDSLLRAGVEPKNLLVIGASAGWNIALQVSSKLKNKQIKYVVMGGCWPDTYKDYLGIDLYGKFLSIIETTDPHGSCYQLFENRPYVSSFKEIKLNTGLSHGFIYKGHKEWIDPIVTWFIDSK